MAGDFYRKGIVCWSKHGDNSISEMCFEGRSVHASVTNIREAEAFGAEGIFRAGVEELVVLGFPGNGWPSTEYAAVCRYKFQDDANTLSLSGCSLEGDWQRKEKTSD